MKILVYGVTHWDDRKEASSLKKDLKQWYERVKTFVPKADKIFLTAGSLTPQEYNPLPCDLYQIGFYRPINYSVLNNYFRVGFTTGIWKALLDYSDFDILLHCQTQRLIGQDMSAILQEFYHRKEDVMGARFTSGVHGDGDPTGIDVGFMAMKKSAAQMYAVTGLRHSCDITPGCITCEEEAYYMFQNRWWCPWPQIPTLKQIDTTWRADFDCPSLYEISDIEYFKTLPVIAIGKHITQKYYTQWLKANPLKKLVKER